MRVGVVLRHRELGLLAESGQQEQNDIASTAAAYAHAVFSTGAVWPADAMTINPYLGRDAVEPFLASIGKPKAASSCW